MYFEILKSSKMQVINFHLNEKNVYVKILMKRQPSEILRILVSTWHD